MTGSPNVMEAGRCLSDLVLDRVVAFEAAAALEQAEASHLAECARCQARLADFRRLARESAPMVERLVAAAQASVARGRGPARETRWSRPAWLGALGVVVATAAVVAVQLRPTAGTPRRDATEEGERNKGETLRFFRQRGGQVSEGRSNDLFLPGDALRFRASGAGGEYLLLVGIEATGKISVYHPFGGTRAERLPPGPEATLPGSLVLDASPATEYLLAVFHSKPVAVADVARALGEVRRDPSAGPLQLAELAKIALPGRHHWIVIRKP